MGNVVLQGLLFILGFGSILFLTYVTTRYLAGKSNKAMKGKYINIVETVSLGLDKRLHLVKVGEQFFVIAIAGKSVEFLTDIKLDTYDNDEDVQNEGAFNFKGLFEKYIQNYKLKKKEDLENEKNDKNLISELQGFSFKKNLEKLKEINGRMGRRVEKDGDENTNEN